MKFHCPRVQQVFSFFILLSCAAALLPFPAMAAPCPEPLELEKEKLPEEQRPLARALARYYDALNGKDFDALQAILDPNRPANTHPGPKAFSYRSLLNWKRFRIYATEILCVEPEAGRISVKEWVEAEAYNGTVFYYNSPAVYTFLRTEEGSLLTARGTVSLDPLKTRDPFELLHLFRDALYRGEVPSALNAVERYLAERPGDYYALAMKGALQLQIQGEDTSVACATLETALEKMKRGAQVCTQLRQALFDAQVFDSLASCHQRKNDLRGALEHLRTALRRNPEYVPALLRRAEIEEESGRAQEAHRLYESAYRVLPDLPEAELALFGE